MIVIGDCCLTRSEAKSNIEEMLGWKISTFSIELEGYWTSVVQPISTEIERERSSTRYLSSSLDLAYVGYAQIATKY